MCPIWNSTIHQVALEASTSYSKYPSFPNAAERIKNLEKLSEAQFKIIYVIRDPVDLATSFYYHAMTSLEWGLGITQRLFDEDKLAHGLQSICAYSKHLDLYHRHFEPSRILTLHFEDLIHHSEATLNKICDFLELELKVKWESNLIHAHSSQGRIADFFEHYGEHVYPGLTREKMLAWKLSDAHREQIRTWAKDDSRILNDKYNLDTSHWTYGE
ncbi:MAG: sulfotransferase domain-containing protein [Merismopedia sp. SIO2A8]|nr:sulfotransferase domain-containing protein [Merismopedia sp. SIO2A8]